MDCRGGAHAPAERNGYQVNLKITFQGSNDTSILDLSPGFHHIRWSLGVHVLANGDACLVNGIGNADAAGGIYVKHIEADGVVLCDGNDYLPPRCVLPIRKSGVRRDVVHEDHLPARRPQWDTQGNTLASKAQAAISAGVVRTSDGFFFNRMGPWYPYFSGQPQPGAVSGQGIEFLPGWERNSTYRLLLADHTMHHTALAYCDTRTGLPLSLHQPKYGLSRGYSKETQLAEFVNPATSSIYDDSRVPKDCNAGTCAYKNTITGLDRYNGCLPDDGQHLIRAIRHAIAGWLVYADPLCKLYLDIIAGDCALRWGTAPAVNPGQGAPWSGREVGWVLYLFKAVQHRSGILLENALHSARMPNSLHQRCAFGAPWGFAPDPWANVPPYANHTDDVAPSIEASIMGYSADSTQIALALTRSGNPSHFMRVAPNRCDLDLNAATERESFNVWACYGKAIQGTDHPATAALLSRIPTMRLPDDPKQYMDAAHLMTGAEKNPHIEVTAALIKGLESL